MGKIEQVRLLKVLQPGDARVARLMLRRMKWNHTSPTPQMEDEAANINAGGILQHALSSGEFWTAEEVAMLMARWLC